MFVELLANCTGVALLTIAELLKICKAVPCLNLTSLINEGNEY